MEQPAICELATHNTEPTLTFYYRQLVVFLPCTT